jgi:hypothetical protein
LPIRLPDMLVHGAVRRRLAPIERVADAGSSQTGAGLTCHCVEVQGQQKSGQTLDPALSPSKGE